MIIGGMVSCVRERADSSRARQYENLRIDLSKVSRVSRIISAFRVYGIQILDQCNCTKCVGRRGEISFDR